MNGLYRRLTDDQLKGQQEAAKQASKPKSDRKYLRCEEGEALYFFLLPPFSDRMSISRDVWKYFNLPDDKNSIFVAWSTYDIYEAGIGEKDPILQALRAVDKHAGGKTSKMWPGRKAMMNVILAGKKKADESGNPIGEFIRPEKVEAAILEMSGGASNILMSRIMAPGLEPAFYPDKAIMIELIRKTENGKTKYSVDLVGTKDPMGGGFKPNYVNLFETYGNETMTGILQNLTDLDSMWKGPKEEDKVIAHRIANAIRVKFGIPGVSGVQTASGALIPGPAAPHVPGAAPPPPDGAPAPVSMPPRAIPSSAPPWIPGASAPQPPTPTPTPAVVASALPAAAPASPPPSTPAPAASNGVSLEMLLSVEPIDAPPKEPGKVQPVCFKSFKAVQASPLGHKKWCGPCNFKQLCEMMSK